MNPVVITAHVVTRLQTIVSREAPPEESVPEKMRHLEMPHSPYYFPGNEVTLRTGIEAMAAGALAYLR